MEKMIWKELYSDYMMALLTWKEPNLALMITMVGVRVTDLARMRTSDRMIEMEPSSADAMAERTLTETSWDSCSWKGQSLAEMCSNKLLLIYCVTPTRSWCMLCTLLLQPDCCMFYRFPTG